MRVLLVEDNLGDAVLVQEYVHALEPNFVLLHVSDLRQAKQQLEQQTFDAILLDLSLPDAQGLETVRRTRELSPTCPIVVMSGTRDRETAVAALQNGAQDFLVKGRGDGDEIIRALRYAVERADLVQRLEQSNLRLALSSELALSAARMVSWEYHLDSETLISSSNAEQLLGGVWTSYNDFWSQIHPEDQAEYQQIRAQAITQKQPYQVSYRFWHTTQAQHIWLEEHGMVRLNGKAEAVALSSVTQDITARKNADLHLRRINEAQKRFVGDAAHELRAPLTSIQGNLQLLQRYPDMPVSERAEMVGDAYREASRLGRLVADLLSLARGDAGHGLRLESVLLHHLLTETLRYASHLTTQHRLETTEFTDCTVLGDRDRLKQLLLILLENAIKYTPAGGWVRVSLECDPAWAELRVQDSGIGIAAEDLPLVFERFFRVDKGRTRGIDPSGTGLGLPIAQWIVAQHGGDIRLESQLGMGTTVIVRLPIAP